MNGVVNSDPRHRLRRRVHNMQRLRPSRRRPTRASSNACPVSRLNSHSLNGLLARIWRISLHHLGLGNRGRRACTNADANSDAGQPTLDHFSGRTPSRGRVRPPGKGVVSLTTRDWLRDVPANLGLANAIRHGDRNLQSPSTERTLRLRKRLEDFVSAFDGEKASVIVDRLVQVCGAPALVFGAKPSKLRRALGEGNPLIRAFTAAQALSLETTEATWLTRPVLSSPKLIKEYLGLAMAQDQIETLRVLFVDRKCGIICSQIVHKGTRSRVDLDARTILHLALDYGAEGIILAHNHPSGDPTPTQADRRATHDLKLKCGILGIELLDHIVIASGGATSMYSRRINRWAI